MRWTHYIVSFFLFLVLASASAGQLQPRRVVYLSYDEVKPILNSLADITPEPLKSRTPDQLPTFWSQWVKQQDEQIRRRLQQGDEDSIVNLLLFGTSFSSQPRITLTQIKAVNESASANASARLSTVLQNRLKDLLNALHNTGRNERLMFAKLVLSSKGVSLEVPGDDEKARALLLKIVERVFQEARSYARIIDSARTYGDASAEFAELSRLYKTRGLSSDTSLRPNFAIDSALNEMKTKGLLRSGISRVAIVGPGLDFTDKQDGYDFYPEQTIQPFAVFDSLMRLGLADEKNLKITTLDLSPRVNSHIGHAHALGVQGQPYVINLPLDDQERWSAGFIKYWEGFGSSIGVSIPTVRAPENSSQVRIRAVRVRPIVPASITPSDANIVLQRIQLAENEKFDLIVGTNIFVYYDTFEQSLALLSVEKMLKPGGFLLSNNALLELPSSRVKSMGYSAVNYSEKLKDGDIVVWYKRLAD
jgi:hypothetical protein